MEKSLDIYFGLEKKAPIISFVGGYDIKDISELKTPTLKDNPVWAIIVENGLEKTIHNYVIGSVEEVSKINKDRKKYYIHDEQAFLDECLETTGLMLVCKTKNNKNFARPFTENDKAFNTKEELVKAVVDFTLEFLNKNKQKVKK